MLREAGMASPRITPRVKLGAAVPIFRVENLDRSIAYYVERLGFELQWRSDPLASVGRDRMSIMLSEGDQGQPGTWVWTAVGNVDELYSELHARGARLRHPPTNYPWGSRECQVTDPDGTCFGLGRSRAPASSTGNGLMARVRGGYHNPTEAGALRNEDFRMHPRGLCEDRTPARAG